MMVADGSSLEVKDEIQNQQGNKEWGETAGDNYRYQ